jgi:hypothetical protein
MFFFFFLHTLGARHTSGTSGCTDASDASGKGLRFTTPGKSGSLRFLFKISSSNVDRQTMRMATSAHGHEIAQYTDIDVKQVVKMLAYAMYASTHVSPVG